MKLLAALLVFAFVGLALALVSPKRFECKDGTHFYSNDCGYVTLEATCDNPSPVEDKTYDACDFNGCYCDAPTVRDTVSKKCVKLEDCPKKA